MFSLNHSTKRMDYFGPVVNLAARVASKAAIGEICLSEYTEASLNKMNRSPLNLVSKGKCRLKGVTNEIEIFQSTPEGLLQRTKHFDASLLTSASASSPMTPLSPLEMEEVESR